MKLKNYLETLPEVSVNYVGEKRLSGKMLRILEPYFNSIDELKGKTIKIIDELISTENPNIIISENGVSITQTHEPNLITINGTEALGENIELFSLCLKNGDILVRCTENSLDSKYTI